jgi:hypothetical protein
MPTLAFKSTYPVKPEQLFGWHERPGAIVRLTPPWIDTTVESWQGIGDGHRAELKISKGPFTVKWTAVHDEYVRGKKFIDYQESGPFQYWKHLHQFEPVGDDQSRLTDVIDYQVPAGALGERVAGGLVRRDIERMFAYRHRILGQDIILHRQYNLSRASLRIAITGSSGLIGSQLAAFFTSGGHKVTRIVRRKTNEARHVFWDPESGQIDGEALEGHDAVIHLAGEDVLRLKWDEATKRRIRISRLRSTRLLAETIASLNDPPNVLLTASGISVYGRHGGQAVSEASALKPGGFLTTVAREWEAEAGPAIQKGIRTVFLRIGVVLSPRGGMLRKILPLFQSGIGGRFSGEDQWLSWITLDDVIGAVYHSMMSTTAGPVNLVTPNPVTTAQFARTLGSVLRRPAFMIYPKAPVRKILGETADEMFFESVRAIPAYLTTADYQFMHTELEGALRHVLGRTRSARVEGQTIDLSVLR